MRTQSFFKGLSWLVVLNIIVKPIWIFFIDRQVQNIVGNEAYGIYFSILNLSLVFFFLTDAGFTNMINLHISGRQVLHFYQLLKIKFLLLLIYIIICLFTAWLTHIQELDILLSVIFIQVLTSLYVFARSMVTANQFFYADSWFSVLDKLIMIILCSGFIYGVLPYQMTLTLFLHLQLIATFIAVTSVLIFISKKKWLHSHQKDNINLLIKKTLPFALIIFFMSVHNRLDGFLLQQIHFHGAIEAGIYASGYRLLDAANMAGYMAASFLVPYISRNKNNAQLVSQSIQYTRNGLLAIAIPLVCFTFIFSVWIEKVLYHSVDANHAIVIELCIAALPAYFIIHIYGSLLTALFQFSSFIRILFISAIINSVMNIILIPQMGARGCCIAALFSQYFCALGCLWESRNFKLYLKTNTP